MAAPSTRSTEATSIPSKRPAAASRSTRSCSSRRTSLLTSRRAPRPRPITASRWRRSPSHPSRRSACRTTRWRAAARRTRSRRCGTSGRHIPITRWYSSSARTRSSRSRRGGPGRRARATTRSASFIASRSRTRRRPRRSPPSSGRGSRRKRRFQETDVKRPPTNRSSGEATRRLQSPRRG